MNENGTFKKGRAKTGGRKQGVKNRVNRDVHAIFAQKNFNPIRRAIDLYVGTTDESIKARLITELMKYYAPRLKTVEVKAEVVHWTPELVMRLSDSELQRLMAEYDQHLPDAQALMLIDGETPAE